MASGFPAQNFPDVTRHFVTLSDRQLHYLRAGSGPAVVLLHGSPESSLSMIPFINILKDRFTVFAFDNPGNGNSDPLSIADPTIADFADDLRQALDVLGVGRCAFYGFHTGAEIAAQFSAAWPERTTQVIACGYPMFTQEERADILANYLPPFEPKWDGSHLAWVWARLQEQVIFFPWYDRRLAVRMMRDLPPPDYIQFKVTEFLRAGDPYRAAYKSAFAFDTERLLPQLTVPTLITALDFDPLAEHLERITHKPECVRIERRADTLVEAYEDFAAEFTKHLGDAPAAAKTPAPKSNGKAYQDFVTAGGGQVYYQTRPGTGRPIIALHDPASSSRLFDDMLNGPGVTRPVYAFDLPGNGESDNSFGDGIPTIKGYAQKLSAILDALDLSEVDIIGYYSGGYVGAELARAEPQRVKHVALIGIEDFSKDQQDHLIANYTPDMSPRWDGTHLITAWRMMRAQSLFWPWFEMKEQAIIKQEPYLDETMLQRRVTDLMKCGNTYQHAYKAFFTYPAKDRLSGVGTSLTFGDLSWDPARERGQAIAETLGLPTTQVPDAIRDWGAHFERVFA